MIQITGFGDIFWLFVVLSAAYFAVEILFPSTRRY